MSFAGVSRTGTPDQVNVYDRVSDHWLTTPLVADVPRTRQKNCWPIVCGSRREYDVLFVVYEVAPMKSLWSSTWSVYDFAPASGFQPKRTGWVGKSRVTPSPGAVSVGAAPQSFVNDPVAENGPTPLPPSVPATRQ